MRQSRTFLLFDGFNHLCAHASFHTESMCQNALNDALSTISYLDPTFTTSPTATVIFVWDAAASEVAFSSARASEANHSIRSSNHPISSKSHRMQVLPDYKKKVRPAIITHAMDAKLEFDKLLQAHNIHSVTQERLEADDLIAFYTHVLKPSHSVIVSQDNDFLQLVSPTTSLIRQGEWVDAENFQAKIGMTPQQYLKYKAIAGDRSDNIPAVKNQEQSWLWALRGGPVKELTPAEQATFLRNLQLIRLDLWCQKDFPASIWRSARKKLAYIKTHESKPNPST